MSTAENWREQAVLRVTLTVLVLSVLPIGGLVAQSLPVGFDASLWITLACWAVLAVSTVSPGADYRLRAVLLIGLSSLATLLAQLAIGFSPNAGVVLAFAVVLTAVIFGGRAAVAVTAMQVVGLVAIGAIFHSGRAVPPALSDPTLWQNWARSVLTYAAFTAGLAVLTSAVVKRLEAELAKTLTLVDELKAQATAREEAVAGRQFAETQLLQAQKMEAVGRIAGGVAHDFNNLLAIVQAGADRLEEAPSEVEVRKIAGLLSEASARAAKLTRSLLDFSNPGGHTAEELRLNQFVEEALETIRRVLPRSIVVKSTPDPVDPIVHLDAGKLHQVLLNLAINARDAMPDGGTLSVLVDANSNPPDGNTLRPGSYVRLVVKDTGTGMSLDTMARVFDPFFTTKTPDHGSGLGLSQAYSIVDGCGGMIDVDSELGKGTRFQIWLPFRPPNRSGPVTPEASTR